jgi:hypothetical protein
MTQGNPGYGPPPGSPSGGYNAPPNPYGGGARTQSFGVVGAAIAIVGAAAVIIAFTALDWFKGGSSKVSDIKTVLDAAPSNDVSGLANAYFSWLCWVLLAVAAIAAIAANAPSPASGPLRGVGVVVGLAGAVLTLFAIKLSSSGPQGLSDYLKDARIGFYFAIVGFVVIAVGAAMGPRRV